MGKTFKRMLKDVLPYILVVGLGASGVYLESQNQKENRKRDAEIARIADYNLCTELNKNRMGLLALINLQGAPIQAPEGSPSFVQEILDASAQRGASFRERAAQEFPLKDCQGELAASRAKEHR
jgi:hypothetical protein